MLPSAVSLRSMRQDLLERPELQGVAFATALAAAADRWLTGLLHDATGGDTHGVALVAVGGYGRGELCPYSDLDVVLVHKGRRDAAAVADAVWYPVWDEGIRLDHSVRAPAEVLEAARQDLRVQLGLLDGRVVAGDASVADPMLEEALTLWKRRAGHWLPILAGQAEERHRSAGDVAFLLEPDLKEGHGGLRDLTIVGAVARAVPTLAAQVDLGSLAGPGAVLTSARVELHRLTARATDRLLLQEQDQVAAALGYGDADALMAAIAEAGRTVAWVTDDVWRRRSAWPPPRPRRGWRRRGSAGGAAPTTVVPVEPGVAVQTAGATPSEAQVVLEAGADPAADPALPLRVAAVAAERGLPIDRGALETMEAATPQPPPVWTPELRRELVRVLAAGPAGVEALEALDQRGLLVRLLPEWAAVRNRPQRNAYHRFTVDRHLLEAASQASALTGGVARPDLLLVGALLHDIGKGYPGDHTEVGVRLVRDMGRRLGYGPEDVDVLASLVRNHLLLADTATRRDLDDPVTIDRVAGAVGDAGRLELLAALTEADSLATGPAAWGQWKAGLVADLVRRVGARLAGAEAEHRPSLVTDRHRALMRQVERLGRSVVAAETPDVTVVARDRPGLLAAVTGVFALRGVNVRSADVAGEDGFAVEIFVVEPARGRWPDFKLVADELDAVLRGTLSLADRLAEQARVYAGGRRPQSPHPVERRVTLDNEGSAASSVVEVWAEDSTGLLHRITSTLFDLDLDVVSARVTTIGPAAVDTFYVRDSEHGGKVTDPDRIAAVTERVARAVEGIG